MNVTIAPTAWTDMPAIRGMLVDAGLPVEDITTSAVQFWTARGEHTILGAIGLERYAETGLLRSLVVAPAFRRAGVGDALVEALERAARASGITQLVLLTETAEAFFRRHDYSVADRRAIDGKVADSAQFRTCCPASAICMTKSLA